MRLFHSVFTVFVVSLIAAAASAAPVCKPTARVSVMHYPGDEAITTNNNLILPTGKSVEADGQKLVIQGRLVDSQCKPLKEAVVEIWQVNPFGQYELLEDDEAATSKPAFAGTGQAISNADGQFTFTTAFPGVISYQVKEPYKVRIKNKEVTKYRMITLQRAPHINLLVKPDDMAQFSTTLFFDGDRRNSDDIVFKKLNTTQQSSVMLNMSPVDDTTVVATKEIVLPGLTPYRTY